MLEGRVKLEAGGASGAKPQPLPLSVQLSFPPNYYHLAVKPTLSAIGKRLTVSHTRLSFRKDLITLNTVALIRVCCLHKVQIFPPRVQRKFGENGAEHFESNTNYI